MKDTTIITGGLNVNRFVVEFAGLESLKLVIWESHDKWNASHRRYVWSRPLLNNYSKAQNSPNDSSLVVDMS